MGSFQTNTLKVFQSQLFKTTCSVIKTKESIIVVDPNWLPREIETIQAYVDEVRGERDLYVIYTHSDFDHVIGSGAFPDAKSIASKRLQNNPEKESVMREITAFDQEYYLTRNYTPSYPDVDFVIEKDGEQLTIGEVTLTFYLAPGHTNDGLFTVIEPYGIFLAGDYLSEVEFPFIYSSYSDYKETIRKAGTLLEKHSISVLVPGHGSATECIEEIRNRLRFSEWYLNELTNPSPDLEQKLNESFMFFEGMKESHKENRRIVERELGLP
ncbi:MBL fold metallo-hydrolase [Halobacillus litoralis]|uniref:MBL fold metallo-hydrolase n=1 Tax=Halobacillus litoralis TaxID=45668 RepID=UPI001CD67B0B|nr:MBL fold metallo-hydrolase [Halobacillus litoralis]MCA0969290.1 MBL fold metallo-hydrolase [Halobacillus litoralis]